VTREDLRSKGSDAKKNRLSAVVWKMLRWSEASEGLRSPSGDSEHLNEADLLGGEFVLSRGMQPTFTNRLSGENSPRTPLSTLLRAAGYHPRHTSSPSLAGVRYDDREMTCIREDDRDTIYDDDEEEADSHSPSSGEDQDPAQVEPVRATDVDLDDAMRKTKASPKTANMRPVMLSRRRWSMPVGTATEVVATGRVATYWEGSSDRWAQISGASRSSGSFGPYYPSRDFS